MPKLEVNQISENLAQAEDIGQKLSSEAFAWAKANPVKAAFISGAVLFAGVRTASLLGAAKLAKPISQESVAAVRQSAKLNAELGIPEQSADFVTSHRILKEFEHQPLQDWERDILGRDRMSIPTFALEGGIVAQPYGRLVNSDSEAARVYQGAKRALVRMRNGEEPLGTGFFVSEDLVVTAHHVTDANVASRSFNLDLANGESAVGQLVARDKHADLALVRLANPLQGQPFFKLDSSEQLVQKRLYLLGHAAGREDAIFTEGRYLMHGPERIEEARGVRLGDLSMPSPNRIRSRFSMPIMSRFTEVSRLEADVNSWPGNSGGPFLTADGHVVGVVSGGYGNYFARTFGPTAEHIKVLVSQWQLNPEREGVLDVLSDAHVQSFGAEDGYRIRVNALHSEVQDLSATHNSSAAKTSIEAHFQQYSGSE